MFAGMFETIYQWRNHVIGFSLALTMHPEQVVQVRTFFTNPPDAP